MYEEAETGLLRFDVNRNVIAKSAVNSLIVQLIVRLKGIITLPIYTYFLLPGELGVFNLVMVTSSLLLPFFSLNMVDGPAIYFSQEKSLAKIHTMYLTVVNCVLLSTLIGSLFFAGIGQFVKSDFARYIFWILLLLWANTFSKISGFLLVLYQQTGLVVRNTIQRDLGITISSILLVVLGYSYKGLIFANIAVTVITGYFLFRIISRELPYSFALDTDRARQYMKTALPLLPVFLFSWVIQSSDYYILSYFHGTDAVGKYGVVYGIASIVISLTYALNFFWYPVSARLWLDDREKYRTFFKSLFTAFTVVLLLVVVLFENNSEIIMDLLVRKKEYHDAHVIMGTIAFAYSMQVLITLLTAPLYSNMNTRTIFSCYLVGGIINTLLNILLIPQSAIIGAAISTAVSYLVVTLLLGYANYRVASFKFFDSRLLLVIPLFFAGWAGSIIACRHQLPIFEILAIDLLVVVVALFVGYFLIRSDEMALLINAAKEVKKRSKEVI
jgi:O-antigen/teichoic acid export membrane protein